MDATILRTMYAAHADSTVLSELVERFENDSAMSLRGLINLLERLEVLHRNGEQCFPKGDYGVHYHLSKSTLNHLTDRLQKAIGQEVIEVHKSLSDYLSQFEVDFNLKENH